MLNGVLGGWQISGIVQARSGNALIVTQPSGILRSRPDVVDGVDLIVADWKDTCTATGCNYLNTAGFVRVPVSRDDERDDFVRAPTWSTWLVVPGASITNMTFAKSFVLGAGTRLQVRADVFNVLNRANYNRSAAGHQQRELRPNHSATLARNRARFPTWRSPDVLESRPIRVARLAAGDPFRTCLRTLKIAQIQAFATKRDNP